MSRSKEVIVIGITGGVGSGKSKILEYLGQHYLAKVLLADEIAAKLKQPGEICYQALVDLLGENVLTKDGAIDNQKMAQRVFGDSNLLEAVNQLIHPEVKRKIAKEIELSKEQGDCDYVFLEAALLVEGGYKEMVDEMWYIYSREEVRISRLQIGRGYSTEKIESIMSKQLSEKEFRKNSDRIINNSDSLEEALQEVKQALQNFPKE